jgi:thiol-disulfide isomerase/thioredoxin
MTQATTYDSEILERPIELMTGGAVTLGKLLQEKPVYLKFWASWCQPCREQMPHLQQTFETYGDRIHVLAINLNMNDDVDSVKAIEKAFRLTVPIAIDTSGELAQAFDLMFTPYHLLLTQDGNVVFKGHEVSDELESKIGLLTSNPAISLEAMPNDTAKPNAVLAEALTKERTILFFSATWCDWYLKDSRPAISQQCTDAQRVVNELYEKFPNWNWMGVASRLWTKENDLQEYVKRYSVKHDFAIDTSNEAFFTYKVKDIPTLLILKHGIEQFRISDFTDLKAMASSIEMEYLK